MSSTTESIPQKWEKLGRRMEQAHGLFKLMQAKSLWNSMKQTAGLSQAKVNQLPPVNGGGRVMSDEDVWNVDSPVTHNHYHTAPPQQPVANQSSPLMGLLKTAALVATGAAGFYGLQNLGDVVSDAIKALQPTQVIVEQPPATTVEVPDSDYELMLGEPE